MVQFSSTKHAACTNDCVQPLLCSARDHTGFEGKIQRYWRIFRASLGGYYFFSRTEGAGRPRVNVHVASQMTQYV